MIDFIILFIAILGLKSIIPIIIIIILTLSSLGKNKIYYFIFYLLPVIILMILSIKAFFPDHELSGLESFGPVIVAAAIIIYHIIAFLTCLAKRLFFSTPTNRKILNTQLLITGIVTTASILILNGVLYLRFLH